MRPIVAVILSGVLVLSAQQPLTTKTTVKFESSTQLVVEDIIIKDKSGKPVTGLTAADFVVLEDGKPQKVEFVEFQNLEETAVPMQLSKRDDPAVETQTKLMLSSAQYAAISAAASRRRALGTDPGTLIALEGASALAGARPE